mmetsp:Transcript_25961/g.44776  ORF Transcript_25961/g.44776 Transcript_25961/m.44776 type:complete len:104 (+) Transcript_25961:146-457(+)
MEPWQFVHCATKASCHGGESSGAGWDSVRLICTLPQADTGWESVRATDLSFSNWSITELNAGVSVHISSCSETFLLITESMLAGLVRTSTELKRRYSSSVKLS